MKVKFLHILPLMAAVMMATSCNNNDKDPVTPEPIPSTDPVVQDDGEKVIIPYTIQVGAEKKKTTKMQWETGEGENLGITWDFSDNEVELKNKLTVTGEGVSGSLDLVKESGNYYFTGNLTAKNATVAANLRDNKIELTGIYGTALSAPTALRGVYANESQSFDDFVLKVAQHPQLKGTFHFNDENITLVDQQIYLHIIMSPCQHKITINGKELGLPMNGDGWVVLPATSEGDIDLNFLKIKASNLEPGKIYTIDRRGWVDLGLSDGTLWADKNYGANDIYDLGTTHTIFDIELDESLKNITLPTGYDQWTMENNGYDYDLKRLWNECYLVEGYHTKKNNNLERFFGLFVFKSKSDLDHGSTKGSSDDIKYDINSDTYLFLPQEYDKDKQKYNPAVYWTAYPTNNEPLTEDIKEDEEECQLFFMNNPIYVFHSSAPNKISDGTQFVWEHQLDNANITYHIRPILRKNQKPAKAPEPPTE